MTKRDVYSILASVVFVIIAALSLLAANSAKRHAKVDDGWQALNTFAENVRGGKQQITTDKLLNDIRLQHQASESWRKADIALGELMEYIGLAALCGLAFQICALIYTNKRLSKP